MQPSSLSVTFTTEKITEARAFYETHFGAKAALIAVGMWS